MSLTKNFIVSILAFLFAGLLLIYFAAPHFAQSRFVEPHLGAAEANVRKHWPAFREEFAIVQATLDWELGTLNDAGKFLNTRVPWMTNDAGCLDCELRLSDDLLERLGSNEWQTLFGSTVTDGLNFSWMKTLKTYDHWDLFSAPQARTSDSYTLHGSPEYKHLLNWARLRLLAAAKESDFTSASEEVKHLAKLLYSQFTLTSTVAAIAIFKAEIILKKYLESIRDPRAKTLPAYNEDLPERMRRIAWGSGLVVNHLTPEDLLSEFSTSADFILFRCLGIVEGMVSRSYIPPELRVAFKPERDAIIDAAVVREEHNCRLNSLSFADVQYSDELRRSATLARYLGSAWARVLAGTLYTVGSPNPFRSYEEITD